MGYKDMGTHQIAAGNRIHPFTKPLQQRSARTTRNRTSLRLGSSEWTVSRALVDIQGENDDDL
jgi:hypothetical protein